VSIVWLDQRGRQNILFCAFATDRQPTAEAAPNGGSVRDGAGRIPVSGPWPGVIPLAAVPAILQSSHVGWSGPHVRPRRRVAAHPLALAGLGRALAVG
jgi:hypothetical protein